MIQKLRLLPLCIPASSSAALKSGSHHIPHPERLSLSHNPPFLATQQPPSANASQLSCRKLKSRTLNGMFRLRQTQERQVAIRNLWANLTNPELQVCIKPEHHSGSASGLLVGVPRCCPVLEAQGEFHSFERRGVCSSRRAIALPQFLVVPLHGRCL